MSAARLSLSWQDEAACQTEDPALFFPEWDDQDTIGRAVAICRHRCPVLGACLDDALEHSATSGRWGIRGGLTEQQRRNLKRRTRARAA